ncbi:MAG: sigma-70 family RNA polymerase sigma factor [Rhodothermales bacterium]|nr:sigma-70 family RNA polymerase sigma factor [Rhodothermales bacterium]
MQDTKKGCDELALEYCKEPTQSNRDRVCLATEALVRSIIGRVNRPNDDLANPDELYQVGMLAVLQSLDKYDPTEGVRFSSFAYVRIRGAIIDYIRHLDPLPRNRRVKLARVRKATETVSQRLGAMPSEDDVAVELGVTASEVRTIRSFSAIRHPESLLTPRTPGGLRLLDCMTDDCAGDLHNSMEWEDVGRYLSGLSHILSSRERLILELYYVEDLTLSEIGDLLGVSEARISQIRKKSLQTLRAHCDQELQDAA